MTEQHFQSSAIAPHRVSVVAPQWDERLTFTRHPDGTVRTGWNDKTADDVLTTLVDWGKGALTLEFTPGTFGRIGVPDRFELTIDDPSAVDALFELVVGARHYEVMPADELAAWNQLFNDEGHLHLEPGEADMTLPRLVPVRGIQRQNNDGL